MHVFIYLFTFLSVLPFVYSLMLLFVIVFVIVLMLAFVFLLVLMFVLASIHIHSLLVHLCMFTPHGSPPQTYGEDPTLTAHMGAAFVTGMQFLGGE